LGKYGFWTMTPPRCPTRIPVCPLHVRRAPLSPDVRKAVDTLAGAPTPSSARLRAATRGKNWSFKRGQHRKDRRLRLPIVDTLVKKSSQVQASASRRRASWRSRSRARWSLAVQGIRSSPSTAARRWQADRSHRAGRADRERHPGACSPSARGTLDRRTSRSVSTRPTRCSRWASPRSSTDRRRVAKDRQGSSSAPHPPDIERMAQAQLKDPSSSRSRATRSARSRSCTRVHVARGDNAVISSASSRSRIPRARSSSATRRTDGARRRGAQEPGLRRRLLNGDLDSATRTIMQATPRASSASSSPPTSPRRHRHLAPHARDQRRFPERRSSTFIARAARAARAHGHGDLAHRPKDIGTSTS